MRRWIPVTGLLLAAGFWPELVTANPIVVNSSDLPRDPKGVSGVVTLVCFAALAAESVCVALLAGRSNAASIVLWFAITLVTFVVFIAGPTGDWAPIGPSGARLMPSLVAEALIVLVESLVLWRMWFRAAPKGAARAFGIALLGNLVSLAIGGAYALLP